MNGVSATLHTGYDGSSQLNLGDGSGGSDTDTSRTDIRASGDVGNHARTSSVKRPASFKPVSFAKFSIAKTPGSAQSTKGTVEKGNSVPVYYDRHQLNVSSSFLPF